MNTFIKKYEYNYIKKCLNDLNNSFKGCLDKDIIQASKSHIQEKILNTFSNLSEEEFRILDISEITKSQDIDNYLASLYKYVYGMPKVTNAQLNKLFKKEKKLKLPKEDVQERKNVYLGWVDESIENYL